MSDDDDIKRPLQDDDVGSNEAGENHSNNSSN